MRMMLTVAALLSTFSAWALPVYNCDITAISKDDQKSWSKKLLLSPAFSNYIEFNETFLDLRVLAGGVIAGEVNGLPFNIDGDVIRGSFESAYHEGTIKCSPEIELAFVVKFHPRRQFFTLDPLLSNGHSQTRVDLSQINDGMLCFLGDVLEVNAGLSLGFGVVGKVVNQDRIDFTWESEECARFEDERSGNRCVEYRRIKRLKSVQSCDKDNVQF